MKAKEKISEFKYLVLFVILFLSALFLHRNFLEPDDYNIDEEKIEKKLHNLEKKLEIETQEIISNFEINSKDSISEWLIDKDFSELSKQGFIILIYENDTLKFWSDNSITIQNTYKESDYINTKIIENSNGWYEINIRKIKNKTIIGYIKLKNNYSYENRYLVNSFREEFDLPSTIRLSAVPMAHGKNIKDKDGNYIFSIVPINKVIQKSESSGLIGLLYFLSFAFLLIYINSVILIYIQKPNGHFIALLILLTVILVRFLMIRYKYPVFIYSLHYFEPEIYAGIKIFPYLGDFLINAMVMVFISVNIFRILPLKKINKNIEKTTFTKIVFPFLLLIISFILFQFLNTLFVSLVFNSNIPFEIYNLLDINIFTLIAYNIFGLLIISYILFVDRLMRIIIKYTDFQSFSILFIIYTTIFSIILLLTNFDFNFISYVFYIIITYIISVIRFKKIEYQYFIYAIFILFSSIFISIFVSEIHEIKQTEVRKTIVNQLLDERDDVAELLINEMQTEINTDQTLINYLNAPSKNQDSIIVSHLQKKYFYGFWKKYELNIFICENNLIFPKENQSDYCANFFNEKYLKTGRRLSSSNFYFIDNHNGTISYFGFFKVPENEENLLKKTTLYIQLSSKLITKEIGYPELLLDEKVKKNKLFSKYSYAKYRDEKLITKSGNFPYDFNDKIFQTNKSILSNLMIDGYQHTIFRPDSSNSIILSEPSMKLVDILVSFAYLFVFFNILTILTVVITNIRAIIKNFTPNFNNKIRFSMLFLLFLTFITFSIVTVYYSIQQHKVTTEKEMSDKIQTVLNSLEHNLFYEKDKDYNWKSDNYSHLDELMIKFSQVFFSDINIYDLNGTLLATSRPEIFNRGLIGKQMNRQAYTQLVIHKKTQFTQNEYIGNLKYASVYIPFKDNQNNIVAYLNLPYFTNPDNLRKDISTLIVTIINVYVVLFLIAIFVAFLISSRITQPLRMLQDKFREIQLGKKHQEISYSKQDEIGGIIDEYNRMVKELSENIRKLADSERESAWREMAKQIAHEIKNPLTPMKLSVQLLQRAWNDNRDDFDKRLEKVSVTIIEQIDTLSSIASEFSAFAKMPKAQDEEVDLVGKIETIVQLFENTRNIDINLNLNNNRRVKILADKEQLSRVFINLIKNGIQSIPEGIYGYIDIQLSIYGNKVKVTIRDNGSGIPDDRKDKLFQPSFTTKTKGMGMGLAIVKNIINNANGEIWFESEVGKGTEFFIEFPIFRK